MNKRLKIVMGSLACICTLSVSAMALTHDGNGQVSHYEWDSTLGNHEIGVERSYGGTNTYGYSWVDTDNNDIYIYTRVKIGGTRFDKAYGKGYAQSRQEYRGGNYSVSEEHGN